MGRKIGFLIILEVGFVGYFGFWFGVELCWVKVRVVLMVSEVCMEFSIGNKKIF